MTAAAPVVTPGRARRRPVRHRARPARSSRRRQSRSDAGSATVWTAALLLLVATATVLTVGGATATASRHAAQLAADLSALAGAGRIGVATADACAEAGRVAAANHAVVRRCVVLLSGPRTGEVRVEVGRPARWGGFDLAARARARAARVPAGRPRRRSGRSGSVAHRLSGSIRARPHTDRSRRCGRADRVAA